MENIKRYSDVVPYEKRRYWYFTLHGLGPGTIPKDLSVLETCEGENDKGTKGLYICLDGVLNTSELSYFDLKELSPPDDLIEKDYVEKYLRSRGWVGKIEDVWIEDNEVHIYIIGGDWKHQHLYCKQLMEELGYEQVDQLDEESDNDSFSAEHIYEKRSKENE